MGFLVIPSRAESTCERCGLVHTEDLEPGQVGLPPAEWRYILVVPANTNSKDLVTPFLVANTTKTLVCSGCYSITISGALQPLERKRRGQASVPEAARPQVGAWVERGMGRKGNRNRVRLNGGIKTV